MRASTLFAVILSLLIGLGAAAGARYAGLFDKKESEEKVIVEPRRVPTNVLVANSNLFAGIHVTSNQVTVRELREDERAFYNENKSKLLPNVAAAASLRMPKKNILADTILTTDLLEDQSIPTGPSNALPVDYRLVNVAVSKQNSAGGVLRVGEVVDVMLTSQVTVLGKGTELRTAAIARGCKIVMKRDNLFVILRNDPADKPLEFTLQANMFRSALIEFCKYKGVISLQPAPGPGMMMTSMEDQMKITEMNQSSYPVGDKDLIPIFNVTPPTALTPPDQTRIISGNSSRINYFASKDPQPLGQWFNIGPQSAYGGGGGLGMQAAPNLTGGAGVAADLRINPANGQMYDFNNKSDPNNPGCLTCNKPKPMQ